MEWSIQQVCTNRYRSCRTTKTSVVWIKASSCPSYFCDFTADGIHAYPIYDSGTGFKAEATIFFFKQQTPEEFLPQGFCLSRRLPIFTRRFQRTILGTSELNFCVRNGNRWNLTVIVTDQYDWFSITFLFYFVQCFLKDVPSKLNNHCWHFIIDLRIQANCGQALDLLVHTCWMDHSTYTSCLSTS